HAGTFTVGGVGDHGGDGVVVAFGQASQVSTHLQGPHHLDGGVVEEFLCQPPVGHNDLVVDGVDGSAVGVGGQWPPDLGGGADVDALEVAQLILGDRHCVPSYVVRCVTWVSGLSWGRPGRGGPVAAGFTCR